MTGHQTSQGIWQHRLLGFSKSWGPSIGLVVLSILWLLIIGATWASASTEKNSDSEYSFNWLDPDKKIYVLQNRKYLKANHLELSAMGGVGFSNPYRSTTNFDPRMTYYLSEYFGIELFYTITNNSPNSVYEALTSFSQYPQVREIRAQYGGMIQFIPWYAKINVFNTILHFDWYFGLGAGQVSTYVDTNTRRGAAANYVQQNLTGLFFSTGHLFHLSQMFDLRIDVTGTYYKAPISGTTGDESWFSNYNFGLGIGLKL